MALASRSYISLFLLLIGIILSMALQVSSDSISTKRFLAYPKDGHLDKTRRDGSVGYYEHYNYGYYNCDQHHGHFGGYPYGGYGGYPGYDYPGYGGYPFGLHPPNGAPYY